LDLYRKYLLFIIAIGILIFFFNLGGRDLWEPDETRYAVVAREMRETGKWILPHLNREIYAEKPPLFFWIINLSNFFFGQNNEFTNRFPSALAGFTTMLITFLFGTKLFNLRTGFFSSLVLSTSFFFPQISRWMMLDSLFTLFFLLSLFSFYLGYKREERRRGYYIISGFFMGLATLTKGPIAYLTIPIFLIYAFSQMNLKRFWCNDLLWGTILSILIILIWFIPACIIGGNEYLQWILLKQATGRFFEGGVHFHPQPFYFYLIRFPLEFFPWIIFLPSAFIFGLRKGEKKEELLFLSIWFIFLFLFFSLSKGKKDNYLLPIYPAGALMVGFLWDLGIRSFGERKIFIISLILLTSIFLIGSFIFLSEIPIRFLNPLFKEFESLGSFIFSYLLIGSLASVFLFIKGNRLASFLSLIIVFSFLHLHISYSIPPRLNEKRSMKRFAEGILKRMESGDELKTIFSKYNGLLYYTKMLYIEEIGNRDRLIEVLDSPKRVFIVFQAQVYEEFRKSLNTKMIPLEKTKVGRWNLVLVSNR